MIKTGDILPLPKARPELTKFLETRRSNLAKEMKGAGPSAEEIERLLTVAARVPDHRKLAPWRFIIFEGNAREHIGAHIQSAFDRDNPNAPEERSRFEAERFLRAPLVIAVVSAPVKCPRGTPEWEQVLSSGAVCYNLLLAAQSLGFGAQWLTEWYSYDAGVMAAMGLDAGERISGLVYIGTAGAAPTERARPDLSAKVTRWEK